MNKLRQKMYYDKMLTYDNILSVFIKFKKIVKIKEQFVIFMID